MIKIIIGLIGAMLGNILLGSTLASFKKEWNKEKLISGIYKAGSIITGLGLVYLCGYLNPDIIKVVVDGKTVNLIEALKIIFISATTMYAAMDIKKAIDIFKIKVTISEEPKEEEYKTEDTIGLG